MNKAKMSWDIPTKVWLFIYERGKLVGREEAEEKIDNLEKDRDLLKEENAKLRAEILECDIQEYAGARYTCKHCGRIEGKAHYSHCPIVRLGLEKEQTSDE